MLRCIAEWLLGAVHKAVGNTVAVEGVNRRLNILGEI